MGSDGPSRRRVLQGTGAALATAVGVGAVSSSAGGQGGDDRFITLENDSYDVTIGAVESSYSWEFQGRETLFEEYYMLRAGDTLLLPGAWNEVLSGYPSEGAPGQRYDATAQVTPRDTGSGGTSETAVTVTRGVELSESDPRFTVFYEFQNDGPDVESFQLYQYVDYDMGTSSENVGAYSDGTYTQLYPSASHSIASGFRGSRPPDSWHVGDYNDMYSRISDANLQRSSAHWGDTASVLRWDFGALASGSSASLAVGFAAGESDSDVQESLSSVDNPAKSSGGGGQAGTPGFGIGGALLGVGASAYALRRFAAADAATSD